MKPCIICLASKPLSHFYRHPQMADGHVNKCKECYRAAVNSNRERRHDYYLQYDRSRCYDRSRKARKMTAPYTARQNADHRRVGVQVRDAIRRGVLVRPTKCDCCGQTPAPGLGIGRAVEGHHRDYNKPFSILWLCRSCHRREHAEGPKPIALRANP